MAEFPVLGAVRFEGPTPILQDRCVLFTTGMVGMEIALEFDSEWDEFPYRKAAFFAVDSILMVDIVADTVVVPAQILDRAYTKVYMGALGEDADPDDETLARQSEIVARLNALYDVEIPAATEETVGALMDECSALWKELDSMNIVRKRMPTTWLHIGRVVPGAEPDGEVDDLAICHW